MEQKFYTVTIRTTRRVSRRRQREVNWKIASRLSLLALGAMFFARLVLLMIDLLEFGVGVPGAVTAPACALVFMWVGWKLREWTAIYKYEKEDETCEEEEAPTTTPAPTAGRCSTPESSATVTKPKVLYLSGARPGSKKTAP